MTIVIAKEIYRVPKIGLVPPRELSFLPTPDGGDSPLMMFMKNALESKIIEK